MYDMVFCVDTLTVDDIVEILSKTVRKKQFQETQESIAELQQRVLLAKIYAMLTPMSPHAKVKLLSNSSIELTNMDGRLRNNQIARQEFSNRMKKEVNVEEVFYMAPVHPEKGHINNFYNIDVA